MVLKSVLCPVLRYTDLVPILYKVALNRVTLNEVALNKGLKPLVS
jgi:hypothetical protein